MERHPTALVRQEVEKLSYVSRTWFEWTLENGDWFKELVIEVKFDTDPNSVDQINMDELRVTFGQAIEQGTLNVHHVRVVPQHL